MSEKFKNVDFETLSKVANNLKDIDFQKWNRDLNDIQSIKIIVAGYDSKVNEILQIMRKVNKFLGR